MPVAHWELWKLRKADGQPLLLYPLPVPEELSEEEKDAAAEEAYLRTRSLEVIPLSKIEKELRDLLRSIFE